MCFAYTACSAASKPGTERLRHTTGTLLSNAGVPIQIIQKVLGHADIKVTEGHYLHHDTRDTRKALDEHLRFAVPNHVDRTSRRGHPARTDDAWYTWYTEAVASGRIAVANGRIFWLNLAIRRPFPSVWVRLRPFSTPVAAGSIPGASTFSADVAAG
jgi:hypothetical protein